MYDGWGWRPYVSAAQRRLQGLREVEKLRKKGHAVSPVILQGRTIAGTFWGKAWCDNLEQYSDFSNRLPRGRTYVRNGSIIDLQVASGEIKALVSGSAIYRVTVKVTPVNKARWKSICQDCAGGIDSLVELLQGRFSQGVMERMSRQKTGLFPSPGEIEFTCSCPDWAGMCKHIAAVLYGIGARLDKEPELLFRLHQVDEKELIAKAGSPLQFAQKNLAPSKVLGDKNLSELFALDMAQGTATRAKFPDELPPRELKRAGYEQGGGAASGKKKENGRERREKPPTHGSGSAVQNTAANNSTTGTTRTARTARTMTKTVLDQKMKAWEDARKRHHLSHAHVDMARKLGMNPKKLGKIDNHKQEPWKAPLPEFIEELYAKRFGRSAHRAIVIQKQ